MRIVHADASVVTAGIKDIGVRLEKMESEVREWDEAIGKVEEGLKDVAGRICGAMDKVEEAISELKTRIENLER
jgi:prefoldin subunit 5